MAQPISWVISTFTWAHVIIWAVLVAIYAFPRKRMEAIQIGSRISLGLIQTATLYGLLAIIVGQAFGEKYSWHQLWPAGLLLGCLVGLQAPLIFAASGSLTKRPKADETAFLAAATVLVAVPLFSLFFASAMWALPRISGFGLFELPEYAWAVDNATSQGSL